MNVIRGWILLGGLVVLCLWLIIINPKPEPEPFADILVKDVVIISSGRTFSYITGLPGIESWMQFDGKGNCYWEYSADSKGVFDLREVKLDSVFGTMRAGYYTPDSEGTLTRSNVEILYRKDYPKALSKTEIEKIENELNTKFDIWDSADTPSPSINER